MLVRRECPLVVMWEKRSEDYVAYERVLERKLITTQLVRAEV
jgi:hypothetical protein